jgi:hypothetical protein
MMTPPRAASLVALLVALALPGCRRTPQASNDPLQLVPGDAQLLLQLDLAALRRAAATAALLKPERSGGAAVRLGFDPRRDLDTVLFGAGSGRGQLDFVVLLAGRVEERRVLEALRKQRQPLEEQQRRRHRLYSAPRGERVYLIFPRDGLMAVVSEGWVERLLDRLEGRGPGVTARSELARRIGPVRGRAAWAISLLSPASGQLAARRLGWAELGQLATLQASLEADANRVLVQGAAHFRETAAARAFEQRLRGLLRERDLAPEVHLDERELRLHLSVSEGAVRELWDGLRSGR